MAPTPRLKAIPFGERGLLVEVAGPATTVAAVARAIAAADLALDVGVGSESIAIVDAAPMEPLRRAALQGLVSRCILAERGARLAAPALHRIGVVYDGPDLAEVASLAGLTPAEVIRAHIEREVEVAPRPDGSRTASHRTSPRGRGWHATSPYVLGPDAAVTGGYPIVGVLRKASLWSLYRLRPGARVRFEPGGPG